MLLSLLRQSSKLCRFLYNTMWGEGKSKEPKVMGVNDNSILQLLASIPTVHGRWQTFKASRAFHDDLVNELAKHVSSYVLHNIATYMEMAQSLARPVAVDKFDEDACRALVRATFSQSLCGVVDMAADPAGRGGEVAEFAAGQRPARSAALPSASRGPPRPRGSAVPGPERR
jgi:hypothetical protein